MVNGNVMCKERSVVNSIPFLLVHTYVWWGRGSYLNFKKAALGVMRGVNAMKSFSAHE